MKLGMESFAYRWAIGRLYYRPKDPMDVHALIDQCVRFKLHAVLLCNNIELHTLSDSQILEIKEHLDKEKVDVEVGARGVDQEYFKRMLEICHLLGAKILRVGWDMDRTTNLDKQVQNGIETMKKLMQIANAYGVEIGIENTKVITIQEVKAIIEGVNVPHFGAVIDTCNSSCFITPTE
ncbi:MAG: TIM barrel protein, partial [Erysipelotrichaceae bacterium]|nr:TIM barrel protein [Erysipelotrichaceae bacterium]